MNSNTSGMMIGLDTRTESSCTSEQSRVTESGPAGLQFSGRQLARNSLYNYIGLLGPMLVAFVSIPVLVAHLGTERFGLLSLAWMVVGYFNVFDMGIGRATTKFVAEYDTRGKHAEVSHYVWNAFFLSTVSGVIGCFVAALLTPLAVTRFLNVPPALVAEARATFFVLALSIPIQLLSASARGVLEAQQKFALVNAVRVPSNIASFVVPLLILPFSHSLFVIVVGLTISRAIALVVHLWQAIASLSIRYPIRPQKSYLLQLLGYGKWVTVSGVVAPVMGQMDRFLIGAILTMSAVAFYSTPFDLMSKLFIIPTGLVTVLFPVFSAYSSDRQEQLRALQARAVKYVLLILLPIVALIIALAHPFLRAWLNEEFATHSASVIQLLAIGVLVNSIARVPLSAIEAVGRPDLTARMYLIEVPIYLGLLWWMTSQWGIVGAAAVWSIRLLIESAILFLMMHRLVPGTGETSSVVKLAVFSLLSMCLAFAISMSAHVGLQLIGSGLLVVVIIGYSLWFTLGPEERRVLWSFIPGYRRERAPVR